jgi:hypothetical protein
MKKQMTKSTAIISIATLAVVFVVAIGLILAGNYRKNQSQPKGTPIIASEVTLAAGSNSQDIDKPYVVDSAADLKTQFKLSSVKDFDPANQVLAGVILAAKPNGGYGVTVDRVASFNNQVLIDYQVTQPEEGLAYTDALVYPRFFITLNRTDLPNFSPVNFVFTNLTDGATQTISKKLGAQ